MSPAVKKSHAMARTCPECGARPSKPCVSTVGYATNGVVGVPLTNPAHGIQLHVARLQEN